jgi:hypothetical protein
MQQEEKNPRVPINDTCRLNYFFIIWDAAICLLMVMEMNE